MLKMKKHTKKIIGTIFLSFALILGFSTSSMASIESDSGGSSGGGNSKIAKGWFTVKGKFDKKGNEKKSAWAYFVDVQKPLDKEYEWKIRQAGGTELLNMCKRAQQIWYIGTNSGDYVYNAGGTSVAKTLPLNGLLGKYGQGSVTSEEFKRWRKAFPSQFRDLDAGRTTIVCWLEEKTSTEAPKPAASAVTKKQTQTRVSEDFGTWTGVYAKNISIERQISKVETDDEGKVVYEMKDGVSIPKRIDPIGVNNLENQPLQVTETNFGKVMKIVEADKKKSNANKTYKTSAAVKKAVDAAKAKDKTLTHTLTLSANNKKGLAEGGVLNISQSEPSGTITFSKEQPQERSRTCKKNVEFDRNQWAWVPVGSWICNDWSSWKNTGSATIDGSTNKGTSQNITSFYQILSVHCNVNDFNNLVNASGATVINTGDSTKSISAMAYSKNYTKKPARLDFGDSLNTNPALKKSGTLAFYDKECPFECIADPSKPGASNDNDATNNIVSSGAIDKFVKSGAQINDVASNEFTLYRDNVEKDLRFDVWYPASGVNGVSYNGHKALTTTVNRWKEGTPGLEATDSNGGRFTMKTNDDKELFTGTTKAKTQKNWNKATFSNENSTILNGHYNKFKVAGSWSSEKDRPVKVSVKWEYAPDVTITGAPNKLGFNGVNRASSGTTNLTTKIEGKCNSEFGKSKTSSTVEDFYNNTGSGTTNGLDVGIESPNTDKVLSLFFVRSTGE